MRLFLALAFAGRQVFAFAMVLDLFVIALLLTGVFQTTNPAHNNEQDLLFECVYVL